MRKRLFLIVALMALLVLMVVPALAQDAATVPPAYNWPKQGDVNQSGSLDKSFAKPDAWAAIVSNSGTPTGGGYPWTGELLGMCKLNSDGSFVVVFSRPVQKGECLEFWYSPNGNGSSSPWELWGTNKCVVPIPEPSTIYLMGGGILGLLGYAGLKLRSRKSK